MPFHRLAWLSLPTRKNLDFEVHGPRLNRYANLWAWYLGHQWIYRRELGEPQVTFNWSKAFSDFITNFCFGRGVVFHAPVENEAIISEILREVWETQNSKEHLLWEIGANGGVSGDSFIKVAYEEAYTDPAGNYHPARVRILPLNSAFCVDESTEILTRNGWRDHRTLRATDTVCVIDPSTRELRWEALQGIQRFLWDGDLIRWAHPEVDALTTPDHRWLTEDGSFVTSAELLEAPAKIVLGSHSLISSADIPMSIEHYAGWVWCPTTPSGTWLARRKGVMPQNDISASGKGSSGRSICYMTGNCFP